MDDHGGDRESEVGAQQVARRRERRSLLLVVGLALLATGLRVRMRSALAHLQS